jgi:hypothetical protein
MGAHGRVRLQFIRPGKPVDNAFIESFNGKLHDECLNEHIFITIEQARVTLKQWRGDCNRQQPHSSLGNLTPRSSRINIGSELPLNRNHEVIHGRKFRGSGQNDHAQIPTGVARISLYLAGFRLCLVGSGTICARWRTLGCLKKHRERTQVFSRRFGGNKHN